MGSTCFSSAAALADSGELENMPNVETAAAVQNPRRLTMPRGEFSGLRRFIVGLFIDAESL
jgi:hypothetical protein